MSKTARITEPTKKLVRYTPCCGATFVLVLPTGGTFHFAHTCGCGVELVGHVGEWRGAYRVQIQELKYRPEK